jgi:hypothetical protein
VEAYSGSEVTINGRLDVSGNDSVYIDLNGDEKAKHTGTPEGIYQVYRDSEDPPNIVRVRDGY